MRSSFARDVLDAHDVVVPVSDNHPLVFATSGVGGSSFVLGPGYQVVQSGQVPQALPGQALPHDGSPPPASNPQAAAASPSPSSAGPQSAIVAPSPSPLAASSSPQPAGSSIESASVTSALPSGPMSVQSSAATFATPSSSPPNSVSIPPTSSAGVALSAVPTSTFLPSSTFGTASSPSNITPAVAFSSSTNPHGASFWAAIALVSIAGVATIITLFMWWLRVRARTHRRPWESRWPWGRTESYRFPEDAIASSGTSASWWQPQGGDRDRDVGVPRHSTSTSSDLPSTRGTSSTTSSSAALHLPPLAALSPFAHGPYPTVRPLPLELRRSDTSVPGLMQDVGALHVANLVAGDILTSGDESSRPPTALDDVVGTPREDRALFKPRYLSLNGSGGLDVPWITTPPAAELPKPQPPEWSGPPVSVGAGVSATVPLPLDHNHGRWKERLERSSASHDPPTGTIEAWRDSLRSNIVNALGVFTSPAPAPATAHPSITAYDWQQHPAVARGPSTTSSSSSKQWTLEETRDGAGIVHIRGVPDPTSIEPSASASRSGNDGGGALPRASLVPPRLPHLPPMPSVPRTSGLRTASTKRQYGSRSRRRRPCSAVVRRASSSGSAATSVGSDMSRASGSSAVVARWAQLSEKEAAARRALRQRRLKSGRSGGGVRTQRTRTRGSGSSEPEPVGGGGAQR